MKLKLKIGIFLWGVLAAGCVLGETAPETPYLTGTNSAEMGWPSEGWRVVERSPSGYEWDKGETDEVVDFTVFQADDGSWQIIGCVRWTTYPTWNGVTNGRILYRWESTNFFATNWTEKGVFMTTSNMPPETQGTYNGGMIQAPHVVKDGDMYYMIYNSKYAHMMSSSNGLDWVHQTNYAGSYTHFDPTGGRDIALVDNRDVDGNWYAIYCPKTPGWDSRGYTNVYRAAAGILGPWSAEMPMATQPYWQDVESPFMVRRGGWYYLLLQDRVFAQPNITNFFGSPELTVMNHFNGNLDDPTTSIRGVAPEIVHYPGGQDYLAAYNTIAGDPLEGIEIRPLDWKPSLNMQLSTNALTIPEGSNDTFTVRLSIAPTATVQVAVSHQSGDAGITALPTNLTFTTVSWSNEQPVTVSVTEDPDWADSNAVFLCSSPGITALEVSVIGEDTGTNPDYSLPWSEPFEALTQGGLTGQHGWVAGAGAVVTNADAQSGSQSLSITAATASHTFDGAPTHIWITFWAKPVRGGAPTSVPAGLSAVFYVNTNDQIVAYSNTTPLTLSGTTVSNGWNKFALDCDYSSNLWNLNLNDTPVVSDFSFYGTPAAFQSLDLTSDESTATAYVDEITVSADAPVTVYVVWDGDTSSSWADNGNWSGVPAWDGKDNLVFNSAGAVNLTNSLGADRTINSLTFNSNAVSPVTIQTGNVLTVSGGIVVSSGSADPVINCNINPDAYQTWDVASGRILTFNGVVDDNWNGNSITITGGGTVVLDANDGQNRIDDISIEDSSTLVVSGTNNTYPTQVYVNDGSTLTGDGTLTAGLSGFAINLYSGGTIAPGREGAGTLSYLGANGHSSGKLTFDDNAAANPVYEWEFANNGQDRIDARVLKFTAGTTATLDVIDLNGNGMPNGDYTLISFTEWLEGTPAWNVNFPLGWSYDSVTTTDGSVVIRNLIADTDGDGLPDAWENQYYGSPTNATAGATASNGINTVEQTYIAGIDPTDEEARFEMTDLTASGSDSVVFWSGVSGRVYTVYWTSNLLSGFGVALTNGLPWMPGSFTDSTHSTEQKGFYKIEVELSE